MEENKRTQALLGEEAISILKDKTVMVVGIGGVGSFCAEALIRTGIGSLILVDPDTIEASNFNRQLHATNVTLGRYKTDVLKERFYTIDPTCRIQTHTLFYDASQNDTIFDRKIDFVVDCIDSIASKEDLILACLQRQIPFLSCMGTARKMDPAALSVMELEKTFADPVAKRLRIWKRKNRIKEKIMVLSSAENPQPQQAGTPLASAIFVPATAGLLLAKGCIEYLIQNETKGLTL